MHAFQTVRLNALRRLPDNTYRLTSKEHEDALCRACESFTTCSRASTVKTCEDFIPVFVFTDPVNLDKQSFNTIRLGRAWYDRLESGQIIALYDKKFDRMFKARVTTIYWSDNKKDMLKEHAARNHLGQTFDNPPADLARSLINSYGKNFFANAKGLTAIYLSRI